MDPTEVVWGGMYRIHLAQETDQLWDPFEHGNELSISTEGWKFLDYLSDYQLLKNESSSRSIL
jgi:hypothetical protein